jgi:hypothetical protein
LQDPTPLLPIASAPVSILQPLIGSVYLLKQWFCHPKQSFCRSGSVAQVKVCKNADIDNANESAKYK